jgi:flagellar motor switch protein FliM
VQSPMALDVGVGIVRELPDPGPAGVIPARLLDHVPLEVRAEFASGTIALAELLGLAPGDIVVLETQVGTAASLKVGDCSFASGSGGVSGGRYSFEVRDVVHTMGARS